MAKVALDNSERGHVEQLMWDVTGRWRGCCSLIKPLC